MTGFILAAISSVFFSLYVVPRKFSNIDPVHFSVFTGLGFFLGSLVLFFLRSVLHFEEQLSLELLWCVLGGILWAAGLVALFRSIDAIGLSRSNQWKNLQGPIGVFLSLFILAEYTTTNVFFVSLAAFTMFASALLFNIYESSSEPRGRRAVYLALVSAVAFGAVTVINKHVATEVGVYSQQVVWSFAILSSLLGYLLLRTGTLRDLTLVRRKDLVLGLLSGFLYVGASYFMLTAYLYIPAAIGFTIIQLNAIWTISLGILFFKEIQLRRHIVRIMLGLFCAVAAIGFLVLAVQ